MHVRELTPEALLGAPRRSSGVPNPAGTKVLYSVSAYSFATHEKHAGIHVLDVASRQTALVTPKEAAHDALWLDNDTVVLLHNCNDGQTEIVVGHVDAFCERCAGPTLPRRRASRAHCCSSYVAGTIRGPAGSMKVRPLSKGVVAFAAAVERNDGGSIANPVKDEKPRSSGKIYDSLFVRHWDKYREKRQNTILYGTLSSSTSRGLAGKLERFHLSPLLDVLRNGPLQCPIPPFGGTDHFDIGPYGIILTAKDPEPQPRPTHCDWSLPGMPSDLLGAEQSASDADSLGKRLQRRQHQPRFLCRRLTCCFLENA